MIYEDEPFLDRIDHVADLGFDTVEFWTWVEKDLDAIERRLGENNLSLAGMAATKDQAAPQKLTRALTDPTTQESAVADIKESIEVATGLTVRPLSSSSDRRSTIHTRKATKASLRGYRRLHRRRKPRVCRWFSNRSTPQSITRDTSSKDRRWDMRSFVRWTVQR